MTRKEFLGLGAFGAGLLALFAFGLARYEINQINRSIETVQAERVATCTSAVDQCREDIIIGRAEAAADNQLFLRALQGDSTTARKASQKLSLWGLEPIMPAQEQLYARGFINDTLMEFGPWVVCWQRNSLAYTCQGAGPNAPDSLPTYRADADIALQVIHAGFGRFKPRDGVRPLPPIAVADNQAAPSLSSLYLKATRAQETR
ncbi:MAG: hypothetical protein AAF213_00985 [Pseudomonadota bacterium]